MIQFRFPAPLDNYSGEVTKISGDVFFSESLRISEMKGYIKADVHSVTMGEKDLDSTLRGELFLFSSTYPVAEFIIKSVEKTNSLLEFGQLSIIGLNGTFKMKGKELPLSLPITVEPIIGDNNSPELIIKGRFSIDLRFFDIEGATGPEPEKYTLLITLNFLMSPVDSF